MMAQPIFATGAPVSFGFWQAALLLKKVHRTWQYVIRVKSYTNPDNFFGLGVGHALNFALGQNRLLKLPALPFLVGTRLLDLFEQEDAFRASCRHFREGIRCVQPITLVEELSSHLPYRFKWWLKAKRLTIRIQRIALATFGVMREAFHLTMRIMDVVELVTFDSQRLQQLIDLSVQEGALNIPRCLKALHRNKGALVARLHNNKGTLNRLLKRLGAKKTTADNLTASAQAAIEHLYEWTNAYEALGQALGGCVRGRKKPPLIVPPRDLITAL